MHYIFRTKFLEKNPFFVFFFNKRKWQFNYRIRYWIIQTSARPWWCMSIHIDLNHTWPVFPINPTYNIIENNVFSNAKWNSGANVDHILMRNRFSFEKRLRIKTANFNKIVPRVDLTCENFMKNQSKSNVPGWFT